MAAEWKETLETEREISAFMLELGIPAHLRGYYYLREAVLLAVSDMELVGSVTKLLYPVIARRYKTTLQRVERAIRNAVEVSWERGNPEVFEDLFGFSLETGAPRPTNSEYIARIADKIRMDATTGEKIEK
ncbi:sporulation initiation factor Spo0A C-terminal domain-containing protein [Gallintestinimicrobium sp.]|uniref:sporulation initiation factor Spo0A C-terminal domain-containing protein n=1 Tax=Gallintestinimicrobium sp. TaxID=2981655 RepID=UPI00307FA884